MRTVHYSDVLADAAGSCGTALEDISAQEAVLYRQSASRRLRWAWRSAWWPVVCRVEERWFRADWDAGTAYAIGDEVWSAVSGKYWRASQAGTNKLPETNPTYWTDVTATLDRTIDLDQAGFDRIGDVRDVWKSNPRTTRTAAQYRRDEWEMTESGLLIATAASSVFVRYRIECPLLYGAIWDATRTYAPGNQVYWEDSDGNGDFYNCPTATAAGESPGTHAAKWELAALPSCFLSFMVQGMYADYLKRLGQNEKFKTEDADAVAELTAAAPEEWGRVEVG